MPKILPILSSSLFLLLTVGLFCTTSAKESPFHSSIPDSSSFNVSHADLPGRRDSVETPGATIASRPDSAATADTVGRMIMPSFVGTLDYSLDSSQYRTQDELHWIDYTSLGGILETVPGVYVRSQSSVGQYDQLNVRGYDWRGVAILTNGRILNDPASGIYNLFHFTTEYADRVEIITGPRAFLYGFNSTAGAVNLVTKNYNSNRPFTKFNYSETAYDYQYSDGTFSQNISRKLNFTFGFQHQGTSGRFANSSHEAWNMRTKLRYGLSKNLTIIVSEYLTSSQTDVNGGVDNSSVGFSDAFERLRATMRNTDSYEKISRNDMDLCLVGTLFGDSSNVSLLTLYLSQNLREYRDEENRQFPNGVFIQSDHRSSWMGAQLTQNFSTEFQRLNVGANFELRQVEGSPNLGRRRNTIGAAWFKEDLLLNKDVTISGFARYDRYLKKDYIGFGADASLQISSALSLFGGVSLSRRLPDYQELYWTDSTVTRQNPLPAEKHMQTETGAQLNLLSIGTLRVAYFHRTVNDALQLLPYGSAFVFPGVMYSTIGKIATNGIEARLTARIRYLYLEGSSTYLTQKRNDGTSSEAYPSLIANGGIYYWGEVPGTGLNIKVGFKGRFSSSQLGEVFNPEILAYRNNAGQKIGRGGTLDFFLIARIGDAYVHFLWENLTNAQFFSSPYYPVLDRAIRFGVSWEFLN